VLLILHKQHQLIELKLYVNGEQVTSFTTATYPSLNFDTAFNYTGPHLISARGAGGTEQEFFDGYMTEVNFVDGQQLTPSDFGDTNEDYRCMAT
jgi:hypothetical protein